MHRTCRDGETGLPKWVFEPKTFDPRPTWLKTPWSTVKKIRDADEGVGRDRVREVEEEVEEEEERE